MMEDWEIPDDDGTRLSQRDLEDLCDIHGHDWEEGWVPPVCLDCGYQDELL